MSARDEPADLTCPRCGEVLEGEFGEVPAELDGGTIRNRIECSNCAAPLDLVVGSALPDSFGVEIWVEDRREEDGNASGADGRFR